MLPVAVVMLAVLLKNPLFDAYCPATVVLGGEPTGPFGPITVHAPEYNKEGL